MPSQYDDYLQELADEAGPDEEELKELRASAESNLTVLARDTARYKLKDEDWMCGFLTSFFIKQGYTANRMRVVKGRPGNEALILYTKVVGKTPGWYQVIMVWQPTYVEIYYVHMPVSNLRADDSALRTTADICA